jgi:pyruvate/2-oxoacid:ferredoxin oxidoreductase beta subunit
MEKIYERPSFTSPAIGMGFCPGCSHSTAHKLMAQALDKYGLRDKAVLIYPVGCGGLGKDWVRLNNIVALHGRAAAVGTAIKKCNPENIVISYQGDGDLAAIGMAETMHAANRGENLTVIFINNTNFGMTGGQMAPTTLLGQRTTTSPDGRDIERHGAPFKMAELIAELDAPKFVGRFALHDAKNVIKAQAAIDKAIRMQVEGKGYSFVELISLCPTNWKLNPVDSAKRVEKEILKEYPLGIFKDFE